MDREQRIRARLLCIQIDRPGVVRSERHNGYELMKPDGTPFGFIRYSEGGNEFNVPHYTIYAYGNFRDENRHFRTATCPGSGRSWVCFALPGHQYKIDYALEVLESAYDLN